ncbi:MAG: GNAT family N-acetyltransferase [Bauldia sp.]|nr:GNAT family N-acetyltransferase [Bauldia sp.]
MSTRAAVAADVSAITEIYAEQVINGTATFEVVPPDAAEMARRLTALVEAGYPYFVAEQGGEIIGYSHAGPYRPRPAYRNTVEDSVYLAQSARAQGIGGRLLRLLIDECTARGFRQMIAVIGDSQNVASIRLHKAAGFALAGTLKDVGYKHGRWLDSVLMQLTLGAGNGRPPDR